MKRTLLTLALISIIGLGTAVVRGPNASDDEMAITSGSSASATTSVGPNGTEFKTTIENLNNTCSTENQSTGIDFIGFQGDGEMTQLRFEGSIQTSNPCIEIAMETEQVSDNSYKVNLVEKSSGRQPCTQCIGNAKFAGSFSAPGDYKVEFVNGNQSLGTQETADFNQSEDIAGPDPKDTREKPLFSRIFNWFGNLF